MQRVLLEKPPVVQVIPSIIWNPKFHYHVHMNLPLYAHETLIHLTQHHQKYQHGDYLVTYYTSEATIWLYSHL
jgi:hypothetical protein